MLHYYEVRIGEEGGRSKGWVMKKVPIVWWYEYKHRLNQNELETETFLIKKTKLLHANSMTQNSILYSIIISSIFVNIYTFLAVFYFLLQLI